MKKFFLILVSLGFLCANLAVKAEVRGNCGTIHIQVSNKTDSSCTLKHFNIIHGVYEQFPPTAILSGDSKFVDIDLFGYGPDVELTYECDGKEVVLKSQMDRTVVWGKAPTASIPRQNKGLLIKHTEVTGYCFFQQPGVLNWEISKSH